MTRRFLVMTLLAVAAAGGCQRVREWTAPARMRPVIEPRNVLGPWLLDPHAAGVTVAWVSDAPMQGRVRYGQGDSLDRTAQEPDTRTDHRVALSGLAAATTYSYVVEGEPSYSGSFTTAPAPGDERPVKVLVYGDNRTHTGDHALVVRAAQAQGAQLALHTGDMVANANDSESWRVWFDTEAELLRKTPLIATVGNHEITDQGVFYSGHFQKPGSPTYRSYDYGPLHIVLLDTYETAAGALPKSEAMSEAQVAWLEEDIRAVPPERHVWIVTHKGPYAHPQQPRPGHGGSDRVRQVLTRIHEKRPIGAVFAGHEHFYERGEIGGLKYFVLGGGGAPLEEPDATFPGVKSAVSALSFVTIDVCGCHATGRALDIAGRTLDTFTLASCAKPCPAPAAPAIPVAAATPVDAEPPAAAVEPAGAGASDGGDDAGSRRRRRSRRPDSDAGEAADAGSAPGGGP